MSSFSRIVASDVIRDGTGVELWQDEEHVGEVFQSDRDKTVTVTLWKQDLPLDVVADWITFAKEQLAPSSPE